jgi:large subunit ribosomal protein L29
MSRASELRELSQDELDTHIETQRRELFGLRFQHATGSLEDTSALRNAKRELARALTVANQRGETTKTES